MRILFAPAAKLDLLSIAEYIRKDNPTRAVSFVNEIIDHCHSLADLPRRFPLVPRYEHWGVRRCVHGNYLIFFRVREDALDIIHILHAAMDFESILFPDA